MFTFTLQYKEAIKIAKKIAHSMSTEETRYYLQGFYVHKHSDGKHYAVSTDGHRLTRIAINPVYDGSAFPSVIFPASMVKQITSLKVSKIVRNFIEVTFAVDATNHRYEIRFDGILFGGKLIDGTYPDYQRVIPDYSKYRNEYVGTGINPVYLAEVADAASYSENDFKAMHSPIRVLFDGGNASVILEADPSVLYVLMPMRSSMPEHRHPAVEETVAATAA